MPRKKTKPAETAAENDNTATAVAEPPAAGEPSAEADGPSADGTGKHYGPPYKAIFTCIAKGFELGENRRYKQRVFTFGEKPPAETIALLKESGFTYRPREKAWTAPATAESRVLTDRLARQLAGEDVSQSRG